MAFKLRDALPSENISDLDLDKRRFTDVTMDGFVRTLQKSELLTLALNERAVLGGRGFFLHLPSRDSLKQPFDAERLPTSRSAQPVRAQYTSMLYMDFVWSAGGRQAFFADTHRARYLKSSAIINPPHGSTPLYAIQLIGSIRTLLYATDSLVLFDGPSGYRLIHNAQADAIAGRHTGWFARQDPDHNLRIDTAKFKAIWTPDQDPTDGQIEQFLPLDVEGVYRTVLQHKSSGLLPSAFTAGDLKSIIPRPIAPETGVALGTTIGIGAQVGTAPSSEPSSEPPTRRLISKKRALPVDRYEGGTHSRKERKQEKHKHEEDDFDEDDDEDEYDEE